MRNGHNWCRFSTVCFIHYSPLAGLHLYCLECIWMSFWMYLFLRHRQIWYQTQKLTRLSKWEKDTNYPSEPMGVGLYTFTIKQFAKIGSNDQTQILNSFYHSWFYDNSMLKSDWTKYRNVELYTHVIYTLLICIHV